MALMLIPRLPVCSEFNRTKSSSTCRNHNNGLSSANGIHKEVMLLAGEGRKPTFTGRKCHVLLLLFEAQLLTQPRPPRPRLGKLPMCSVAILQPRQRGGGGRLYILEARGTSPSIVSHCPRPSRPSCPLPFP
ncbi:hypothetical protein J6590_047349 [Homalodisca vitripennis]|nr:hypothetical protein J6590_047349 [Homalodisca vitripennis]